MSKSRVDRLLGSLGLLLAVFYLPVWIVALFGLVALIYYPNFYEILIPAILFDAIYGAPGAPWFGFQYLATAFALVAVYLMEELKANGVT